LQSELEAQARAGGLSERVHLVGLRDDVPALLAAADIFVLPSLSEGLPLAILEAMFATRPIVASDVGGIRAALDDGRAGLLVPPGNSSELAGAIARLLRAPADAHALGVRASERASAEFDLHTMVSRYSRLYRRVLSGARD
jgi:glycosyltransferase involved in cell wall biosynthesis